jgi:membrane-associated phospholipid phosphatase
LKELCRNVRIFGKPFCDLKNILLILLCFVLLKANAEDPADTIKTTRPPKFDTIRASSFILPAALITYGALSFEVHPIRRFDHYVRGQIANNASGFHTNAATYLVFAPIAAVYGLNLAGVEGRNNFADRTALIALSATFAGIGDYSLKYLTHRPSPAGTDRGSFPSGHTMGAFAAAEFLAQEYGDQSPIYTIAGYTVAVTTGVLRVYTRNHWFSDVVAGAGFGIASTKLAYLVYPAIRKWLTHSDKNGNSTFIMPSYQDGMAGLSFAKTF